MHSPAFGGRAARALALAAACTGLVACLASPPAESATARLGTVRAASRARAEDVARVLDELAPRVVASVPGARLEPLEVWVQETPTLYALRTSTYSDTDGFWAEGVRRIHLREAADQVERTLAHELVHAGLGAAWERLPGTLEEGVCDLIASRIVPAAAARLRAGRLATAASAVGGLPIDLELWIEAPAEGTVIGRGLDVRMRIVTEDAESVDPCDVFVVRAGLSSARTSPAVRRAYYGLGFLVAERIAARGGLGRLHDLCRAADEAGLVEVPVPELLAAAEIEPTRASFQSAILAALGEAELREILRLHPGILVKPVADLLGLGGSIDPWRDLPVVRGRVSIPGACSAEVELLDVTALRPRLEAELAARRSARNRALPGNAAEIASSLDAR